MGFFTQFFGCANCAGLKSEKQELEARLFAEIDSNRLRESNLVNAVLQAAGRGPIGAHAALTPARIEEPEIEPTPDEIEEQQIQTIADQFVAEAERNGRHYTPDARIMLVEAIRRDPQQYMY